MSETVPEETPSRESSSPFTRKLGPLPVWAWMAVGLAVALGYYFWKKNSAASTTSTDATSSTDTSGQVPQFVNQTYTTVTPPSPPPTAGGGSGGGSSGGGSSGGGSKGGSGGGDNDDHPPGNSLPTKYPAPTGLKYSKISGTSVRISWNAITGVSPKPTSYTIIAKSPENATVKTINVNASDNSGGVMTATLSGLPANKQLTYYVLANGAKQGSPAAKIGGVA